MHQVVEVAIATTHEILEGISGQQGFELPPRSAMLLMLLVRICSRVLRLYGLLLRFFSLLPTADSGHLNMLSLCSGR